MKMAKVVVSRAGATAIAEIAAIGKPAIIIPLKGSANNHQCYNAEYLKKMGAAHIILQDDLSKDNLVSAVEKVIHSDLGRRLSFNISQLARPRAAEEIADLLV
jgi:UDP-N-acetylglucosamine--N-acetylmuramyl-(pentapeptide) pyrophosphoryl-undecaprenol N-acetylglucosamine transferase